MHPESEIEAAATANPWTGADVAVILHERGWLGPGTASELELWLADAAALLGPHAPKRSGLEDLLRLIFHYDAREILTSPESHAVLARSGAREVIRELANHILAGPEIDSDRFKEVASELKNKLRYRGRELFHPIRLALAGRAGEGELDSLDLLLDRAAKVEFRAPVKGTKQRMLEFCAALD
jgi:glutamyl-tRNA synthetase/nondiscriminating glutamyl-tRNA synthetase